MKRRLYAFAAATVMSLGLLIPNSILWADGEQPAVSETASLTVEEAAEETAPESETAEPETISETEMTEAAEAETVSETEMAEAAETGIQSETAVPGTDDEPEVVTETETAETSETEISETEKETAADEQAVLGAAETENAAEDVPDTVPEEPAVEPEAVTDTTDAGNSIVVSEADTEFSGMIKKAMLDRQETVVCTLDGAENEEEALKIATELLRKVYNRNKPAGDTNNVLNHTGEPVEGDYLKWHALAYYQNGRYINNDGSPVVTVSKVESEDGKVSYEITYHFQYLTDSDMEAEADEAAKALVEELDLTGTDREDYQKVFAIYDYICRNVAYGSSAGLVSHAAYSALINNEAVCQGFATMFYRLALAAGIDNRLISGGLGELANAHGWNLVRIGDKYYYVDTTLDAGNYYYDYFLLGAERFGTDGETVFTDHVISSVYRGDFEKLYPVGENYVFSEDDPHTHIYGWLSDGDDAHHSKCYLCGAENEIAEAHTWGEPEITYIDADDEMLNGGEGILYAGGQDETAHEALEIRVCTKCGEIHVEEIIEEETETEETKTEESEAEETEAVTETETAIPPESETTLSPHPGMMTRNL